MCMDGYWIYCNCNNMHGLIYLASQATINYEICLILLCAFFANHVIVIILSCLLLYSLVLLHSSFEPFVKI